MGQRPEGGPGRWRPRLVLPAAGLAVAAVCVLGIVVVNWFEALLVANPRFFLRAVADSEQLRPDLELEGISQASAEKVRAVFAADTGRSLYLMPLEDRRQRLLAIDWVKSASVARLWPNRVRVRLVERAPVAFVQLPADGRTGVTRTALVDEEGVLLPPPPRRRYQVPAITGLRVNQSQTARRQRVRRMLAMMADLGPLGDKVSEIDVADPDNLRITVPIGGRAYVLAIGSEKYAARLETFFRHYPEIRRRLPNAGVLDLRLEDRITVLEEPTT